MMIPTRIVFGSGQLENLHKYATLGKKAMIIISNGKSTIKNGYLERTQKQLEKANIKYAVFDKIQANPTYINVMEGGAFAKHNKCDFIIALGGGSVMDASKAIAVMATNDGDLWDYAYGKTGKGLPYKNSPLEIIAITTTAGTGSEVDAWGVITKEDTYEKIGFGGNEELYPRVAIIDPTLMLSVPPHLTAYQGFDAFFHSVECYISKAANDMSDMYALSAIEKLSEFLPKAVENGNDLLAREKVALANTLSGVVMCISCCTSEHSMEHAMSAYHTDLPHGAGLIMISKAYFEHFIKQGVCDEKFIRMAIAMGKKNASSPYDFIEMLEKMQTSCGVHNLKMSDYGIQESECEKFAINAKETMGSLFEVDPSPLDTKSCTEIYKKSFR